MINQKFILRVLDMIKSILLLLILLKLEFKKDTDSYFDDMNWCHAIKTLGKTSSTLKLNVPFYYTQVSLATYIIPQVYIKVNFFLQLGGT